MTAVESSWRRVLTCVTAKFKREPGIDSNIRQCSQLNVVVGIEHAAMPIDST